MRHSARGRTRMTALRAVPAVSSVVHRPCPTPEEARLLARNMLAGEGTRWPHVRTAGFVATRLTTLFDDDEAALLLAAATLHDIGYAKRIVQTGFHPLDGALFLQSEGFPDRLAALVAHHSQAAITAPLRGVPDLAERFPEERSLLVDALVYADMHAAPDGRIVGTEWRLTDVARRHPGSYQDARAELLRASISRIEAEINCDSDLRVEPKGLPTEVLSPFTSSATRSERSSR
jgi:hypothetical protein